MPREKKAKPKARGKAKARTRVAPQNQHPESERARLAAKHARTSVENFYRAFTTVRQARNATGAPTDGEQDLLRAAVVFAAGGLDATVKELIRGSLNTLASKDSDVQDGFEKFTRRKLRNDLDTGSSDSASFLAQILVSTTPYETLIENYIHELTGSSLQSVDELFKASAALDIDSRLLRDERAELVEAFKVRNSIIHELDVRFAGGRGQRQRNSRTRPVLEQHSSLLLRVADHFVAEVEKKLAEQA